MIAEEKLSAIWRELGQKYVAAINSFVERGETLGWEVAGEQPRDDRESYAEAVLEFVRRANERREFTGLRDRFPPAHEPFLSKMKENEQFVGPVILLTDGRILVRVGAPYESGCVYLLNGDHVEEIPEVISFGLSANRRYIAIAKPSGVEMREGWEGAAVAIFNGQQETKIFLEIAPVSVCPKCLR